MTMDFALRAEQEQFRESVRRFAEKHLAAARASARTRPTTPWDVAKTYGRAGAPRYTVAEADGGQGGALIDAVIAIETVAAACPRSADVVQAGNFGPIRVLAEYGTPDQKRKYLKRLLAGESVISVGMTEPEAGSAVTDLQTMATPEGDGYRVNGSKVFTTHAPHADVILTYVRYGPGVGGIGSVLIDTKAKGVRFGKPSKFMSGEEWAQIYFENVLRSRRDGGAEGRRIQEADRRVQRRAHRQRSRSLALGRYAYERAREWAMQRKQFGRLLCEFQGLQWKFAEMKMKLDAGQLLLLPRRRHADRGFPSPEETAIAKAFLQPDGIRRGERGAASNGRTRYTQEELVEYCVRRCAAG